MGYSCNAIATFALEAIIEILNRDNGEHPKGIGNGWIGNSRGDKAGKPYFYEVGKERADGAITGPTYYEVRNGCKETSGFRISGNGVIERFPGTSSKQRDEASIKAYTKMVEVYGRGMSNSHAKSESHPAHDLATSSFLVV
jgi:hypothetical protein